MPYAQNPYYKDPWADAATNLATALFGNPELRGKQQLQNAQIDNYTANANYDRARTEGVDIQNTASRGMPAALQSLYAPPPTAAPGAPPVSQEAAFRTGLPAVMALIAQMQGDKVDMGGVLGGMGAFSGSDTLARQGMAAQGQSPHKDFAMTAQRADAIRASDHDADYRKDTAVAGINNRDDIPVANIQAGAQRYGHDRDYQAKVYDVDTDANTKRYEVNSDAYGGADVPGMIANLFPGVQITSTKRTPEHNRAVKGVPNSHHLTGNAADFVKTPGMTIEGVRKGLAAQGVNVIEAIDEGDHFHVAWSKAPPKGARKGDDGGVKPVPITQGEDIDREINLQLGIKFDESKAKIAGPELSPRGRGAVRQYAVALYQRNGGNMPKAVSDAIKEAQRIDAGKKPAAAPAPAKQQRMSTAAPRNRNVSPAPGAKQAADGLWYLPDPARPGKYLRVET